MEAGEVVTLHGITHTGRNKIQEEGSEFRVIRRDEPACLNFREALLLESILTGKLRWVLCENDKHFTFNS